MTFGILQAVVICIFPALIIATSKRVRIVQLLGPVVLCYLVGIVLANLRFVPINKELSSTFTEITVLLAIPLLLFSTDFFGWIRMARSTVISFALCVISVLVASSVAFFIYSDSLPDANKISGMLVGVYTGGTPNMSAIGLALNVPEETFILLNGADVVICAFYLLFLMTVAQRLFLLFLPSFPMNKQSTGHEEKSEDDNDGRCENGLKISGLVLAFLVALSICGLSVGFSFLVAGKLAVAPIILIATSLGILTSFIKKIRNIQGAYDMGQYFLLMFCIAIGTMADVRQIISTAPEIFIYTAIVVYGSIALHLILAALLRLDADTVIITSTAAIFGPAFVGPLVGVLKNKNILVAGLTSGLVGYALGNYLGIGLAWLLGF